HPTMVATINRIVAAAGQMAATVQVPLLTLCDAGIEYHLPGCLRVLEAAHVVEVQRDGPVHVCEIVARTGIAGEAWWGAPHILRLLATHHILREAAPDVFTADRISSLIDAGEPLRELVAKYVRRLFFSFSFLFFSIFLSFFRYFPAFSRTTYLPLKIFFLLPLLILPRRLPASPPWLSSTSAPVTRHFSCGTRRSH
ncbi:hypothetical protein B0H14DRAFT_2356076, partial [Mycena olivaceomarginata]